MPDQSQRSKMSSLKWKAKYLLANPLFYLIVNVVIFGVGLSIADVALDVYFAWKFWQSSSDPSLDKCANNDWIAGPDAWRPYVFGTAIFVLQPGLIHGLLILKDLDVPWWMTLLFAPIFLPAMAIIGMVLPCFRYAKMIPDLVKSTMYGTYPMKHGADVEANEAKIIESLTEAAPQVLIQSSIIVMFLSEYIREQRHTVNDSIDTEDTCVATSKLFGSTILPLASTMISIASLVKGIFPHPNTEIKKLNLRTREAPMTFKFTYVLLCLFTMIERLVLLLFPLGSIFSKEYRHLLQILIVLAAFQVLARWIAFGREEHLLAKAWLSLVLPCYHLKENIKESSSYLILHGLGCQALILALYWYWPEILPIWNTSDMTNIRTGLYLTVEVRDGETLGIVFMLLALSNVTRLVHITYGLPTIYNCAISFSSYKKESSRRESFPPMWQEDSVTLSKNGHFYSDPWLRNRTSTCYACGRVVLDWTLDDDDFEYHYSFCSELHPKEIKTDAAEESERRPLGFLDFSLSLVPVFLIILGIIAAGIIMDQRCYDYELYLSGLIAFFLTFEMVRRTALPQIPIPMAMLSLSLVNHLAIVIFYSRWQCCNAGIPHRPNSNSDSLAESNVKDWPTLGLYWGILSCYWVHLALVVLSSLIKQFSATKNPNKQKNQCSTVIHFGLTVIALGIFSIVTSLVCYQYLLVDPSRKVVVYSNNGKYYYEDTLTVMDVGLSGSPPCFEVLTKKADYRYLENVNLNLQMSVASTNEKDLLGDSIACMYDAYDLDFATMMCFHASRPEETYSNIPTVLGFALAHIGPNLFLLTGGYSPTDYTTTNQTHLIQFGQANGTQSWRGPDLPEPRFGHCAVQIDESTIMVMGGGHEVETYPSESGGSRSYYDQVNTTLFYSIPDNIWLPGPEMNSAKGNRVFSALGFTTDQISCGATTVIEEEKAVLSVAWYYDTLVLGAELWTSTSNQWTLLPNIPCHLPYYFGPDYTADASDVKVFTVDDSGDFDFYVFAPECEEGHLVFGLNLASRNWSLVTTFPDDRAWKFYGIAQIPSRPKGFPSDSISFVENSVPYHSKFDNDKILVVGGFGQDNSSEVINLGKNLTCHFKETFVEAIDSSELPLRKWTIGGTLSDGIFACGGGGDTQAGCLILSGEDVVTETQLAHNKTPVVGVALANSLLVTSYTNSPFVTSYPNSSEIVHLDGRVEPASDLPYHIKDYCTAKINETTLIVIGGYNGSRISQKDTLFYSKLLDAWTPGPKLIHSRHGCLSATIRDSTIKEYLMVVTVGYSELGSSDEGQTKATEILLLHDSVNPEWTLGPDFPDFIAGANIVATSDQRNLIVIGGEVGHNTHISSKKMFKLGCSRLQCKWQEMVEETKHFRSHSAMAMIVPQPFVDCVDIKEQIGIGTAGAMMGGMVLVAYFIFAMWSQKTMVIKL